jgi:hypothetical protein
MLFRNREKENTVATVELAFSVAKKQGISLVVASILVVCITSLTLF